MGQNTAGPSPQPGDAEVAPGPILDWVEDGSYHGAAPLSWVPVLASWAGSMAADFGLPEPEGVWRLPRPVDGPVFLILAGGARYVLRLWRREEAGRLALLDVLRNFAVDHGMPGPRSLRTRDACVFSRRADKLATLVPFVEAGPGPSGEDALRTAARLQAGFHRVLRGFPLAPMLGAGFPAPKDAGPFLWEAVETGRTPFDRAAAEALREAASLWPGTGPAPGELPRQACHFGWHPQNVFVNAASAGGASIPALLEYDDAALGEKALDVAMGMYRFAAAGGGIPQAVLHLRCRTYLHAYHECEPLEGREIDAIPYLLFSHARRAIHALLAAHYFGGEPCLESELQAQQSLLREALALNRDS